MSVPRKLPATWARRRMSGQSEAVFEFTGEQLAGQDVVQITLGKLPRPWTFYARWSALAVLVGLVMVAVVWRRLKRLCQKWFGTGRSRQASDRRSGNSTHSGLATPKPSRKRRRRAA